MSNYSYQSSNYPYGAPPASQQRQTGPPHPPPAPRARETFRMDPYPQAPQVNYVPFGQQYNAAQPQQYDGPPLAPPQLHAFPSQYPPRYYGGDHGQMPAVQDMSRVRDRRDMPGIREIREIRAADNSMYYRQGPPIQAQGPLPQSHPSTTSADVYQPAGPAPHMMQNQGSHQTYWSDYLDNTPTAGAPPPGGGGPPPHPPNTQPLRPGAQRPTFDEQSSRSAAYMAFDRFDMDQGGYLDLQEFMDALRTLNLSISYHDALDRFFVADHNKDGRISREEFVDIYIREMQGSRN